jgi:hypothetical protein
MNWYKIAKDLSKFSQIWSYQPEKEDFDEYSEERTFSSKIKEMYELEYKYSMMKNNVFVGNPQRKENMLSQLENKLRDVLIEIRKQLLETIGKWLTSHALLSPRTWAESRIKEYDDLSSAEQFQSMISEYSKYSGTNSNNGFTEMLNKSLNNLENYPSLKDFLYNSVLDSYMEIQKQEAYDDLEDFNDHYGTSFDNVDDAANWVDDNAQISSDMIDSSFQGSSDLFAESAESYGDLEEICLEFYTNLIFPLWYEYWSNEGIDETRETVETIYNNLENSSSDIGQFIASVNMGLNAVHQTGKMVNYLSEDTGDWEIERTLSYASEGNFVNKLNKELRMVGVKT